DLLAQMPTDTNKFQTTVEWSFAVLRALAMLGGMIALFLVPLHPEHQPHVAPLAWIFVAYKALLFLAIWMWPGRLRLILLGTTGLDLVFVSLFVWHTGGAESHFYLLFYILVALAAAHFGPGIGLATAGGGSLLYLLASGVGAPVTDWNHLIARAATFFLLGGSLGYLSQRERLARAEAERLNEELREHQARLERAYQELQAAQARLVQSERLAAIGQMSAKVSHEVRNPLSSISLNAELLEDELQALPAEPRAEATNLVAAIRSQVDVLSAVTEEYLRFARLPKPKLEATALIPVIEDLAEFVREELRARKVGLVVDVADGMPVLRLDAGQIRQALLNLIRNAAEAMPDGGRITLRAAVEQQAAGTGHRAQGTGHMVEGSGQAAGEAGGDSLLLPSGDSVLPAVFIEVRDTGTGISAENVGKIFEPFFTSKGGGTGLGLPIARQIALDHGGTLTCENAPSGGAIFRLTLPIGDGGRIP
ncbi:MAG TPA: ATP-binding protein, partial [Candidatus Methylomirabilis sp.]|nr:ATP-binding protein [Candidatus Methylomirabilis sp.]